MSSPFIFIATNRLKPGQLESERKRVPGLVEFIETSEPRLIAFNEFVNEAGDEVTVVQIHPDAASMEAHMEIVRERVKEAYAETLDATVRIQVFGRPTGDSRGPATAGGHRSRYQRQRRTSRRVCPLVRRTLTRERRRCRRDPPRSPRADAPRTAARRR